MSASLHHWALQTARMAQTSNTEATANATASASCLRRTRSFRSICKGFGSMASEARGSWRSLVFLERELGCGQMGRLQRRRVRAGMQALTLRPSYNAESITGPLIGVRTMVEQQKCECQSGSHGHRCPHPGEEDGLCKECNEERRAAEANPYGETRSRRP